VLTRNLGAGSLPGPVGRSHRDGALSGAVDDAFGGPLIYTQRRLGADGGRQPAAPARRPASGRLTGSTFASSSGYMAFKTGGCGCTCVLSMRPRVRRQHEAHDRDRSIAAAESPSPSPSAAFARHPPCLPTGTAAQLSAAPHGTAAFSPAPTAAGAAAAAPPGKLLPCRCWSDACGLCASLLGGSARGADASACGRGASSPTRPGALRWPAVGSSSDVSLFGRPRSGTLTACGGDDCCSGASPLAALAPPPCSPAAAAAEAGALS
jgi:hypothetical protein